MSFAETQGYKSINAFSRRPTLPQIGSYLAILLVDSIFWSCLQNHFQNKAAMTVMNILFSISLFFLLLVSSITSCIDPSDPIVRLHYNGNTEAVKKQLDRCLYCQYCKSYVLATSRHCKQCDRCIHKFDHHCVWINNCIGQINYKLFVGMIFSALAHLLLYIIALAILWHESSWTAYLAQMICNWAAGFVAAVFSMLISGLILLHLFLIYNNLTTFEYIISKKTESQRKKFETPIKARLEESKKDEDDEYNHSNNHERTQTMANPLGTSPFIEMTRMKSDQKDQTRSFQFLKETNSKETMPKFPVFEVINIHPEFQEEKQEQQLEEVFSKNRSLRLLVGNSVKIKQRKNSISDLGSVRSQKNVTNSALSKSFKAENPHQSENHQELQATK